MCFQKNIIYNTEAAKDPATSKVFSTFFICANIPKLVETNSNKIPVNPDVIAINPVDIVEMAIIDTFLNHSTLLYFERMYFAINIVNIAPTETPIRDTPNRLMNSL